MAKEAGAWVHVDGAFGLWAAAARGRRHLVAGVEAADSWATDAHKWLNVPYDSGLAIVADPEVHGRSMAYSAAYLAGSGRGDYSLGDLVPDSSRRARGFAVWAALRELGRSGVADLVERCSTLAARMADRLAAGGATIANDVVLNQVLVGFGTGDELGSHDRRDRRRGPARRYVLARRHHLARPAPDPHLGLQRHHHRGRHRPLRRRDPRGGRFRWSRRAEGPSTRPDVRDVTVRAQVPRSRDGR